MNKFFILIVLVFCVNSNICAKKNRLYMVSVSDSISAILDSSYFELTKCKGVNAGVNIHNLIDYKETTLVNGLYSFGGMGPHFPKILFVYYNSVLYLLSAKAISEVMQQLVDVYSILQMKEKDYILYVRYALDFIEESYDDDFSYYGEKRRAVSIKGTEQSGQSKGLQ